MSISGDISEMGRYTAGAGTVSALRSVMRQSKIAARDLVSTRNVAVLTCTTPAYLKAATCSATVAAGMAELIATTRERRTIRGPGLVMRPRQIRHHASASRCVAVVLGRAALLSPRSFERWASPARDGPAGG